MEEAYLVIPRSYREDEARESRDLAATAGYRVVRTWRSRHGDRLGKGLLGEIAREALRERPGAIILFVDVRPSTIFKLMRESNTRVIDRVELILEIFARHAGSREAKLQVEMARIRHQLPLVREWIRRSKTGELPGFLGPGGYAVDSYYRHLTSRLARIRREIEWIRRVRGLRLEQRRRLGVAHVAIVGYASAGKTSLFNKITGESKPVGEEYFTTLQPKHKAVGHDASRVVFVDTVGFIRRVPAELVEAFYSTLEEVKGADAIVFVVDSSEDLEAVRDKLRAGLATLGKIGALGKPIVFAANKIDLVGGELGGRVRAIEEEARKLYPWSRVVAISSKEGVGIGELLEALGEILDRRPGASRPARAGPPPLIQKGND